MPPRPGAKTGGASSSSSGKGNAKSPASGERVKFSDMAREEGWADLGTVGAKVMSQQPDFDARSYGHGKLSSLVEATKAFDVERETSKNGRVDILIKSKPKKGRRTRARR